MEMLKQDILVEGVERYIWKSISVTFSKTYSQDLKTIQTSQKLQTDLYMCSLHFV